MHHDDFQRTGQSGLQDESSLSLRSSFLRTIILGPTLDGIYTLHIVYVYTLLYLYPLDHVHSHTRHTARPYNGMIERYPPPNRPGG